VDVELRRIFLVRVRFAELSVTLLSDYTILLFCISFIFYRREIYSPGSDTPKRASAWIDVGACLHAKGGEGGWSVVFRGENGR